MTCPHCKQKAPVVYRGLMAYCTSCGAPRMPLASASLTFAGKPEKVGGLLTRGAGWLVLVGGWFVALLVFGLLAAAAARPEIGAAVGGPIALASSLLGWLLLRGGRAIHASGATAEREMRVRALMALAAHRGGSVQARDAADMLEIPYADADQLLTDLAKREPGRVRVDLDDSGGVHFRVEVPAELAAEVQAAAEDVRRRRAR